MSPSEKKVFIKIKDAFLGLVNREPQKNIISESTITCPFCGYQKKEHMPVNSCVLDYICLNCKKIIHTKENDCCIFCSYGDVPCPSRQLEKVSIK